MADAQTPSLSDQILTAPASVWKKLKSALKVGTREEAAQLVASNEQAALIAVGILAPVGEEQGSVLTGAANRPSSLLTSAKRNPSLTSGKRKINRQRMQF